MAHAKHIVGLGCDITIVECNNATIRTNDFGIELATVNNLKSTANVVIKHNADGQLNSVDYDPKFGWFWN